MDETMVGKEFSLQGKSVFISGALGLIGKEVCDVYATYGANIILGEIFDEEVTALYGASLEKKYGITTLALEVDISDMVSVRAATQKIEQSGLGLDVYVHLAAIDAKFDDGKDKIAPTSFEDFPADLWQKSVDVNITGTFYVIQQVVKEMLKKGGGNIITVASTYSLVAPDQSLYREKGKEDQLFKPVDYVATKSMIPNFTRYLATFYGSRGIRANCIVPHGIFNNHHSEFVDNFSQKTPLARMCKVEELRGPFVFLASDASSYMTGSTLVVDGGWTAW